MGRETKSLLYLLGASCPHHGLAALGSGEVRAEPVPQLQEHIIHAEEAGQTELSPHSLLTAKHNTTSLSFCCWHAFRMIKSVEEPLPA